MEGLLNVYLSPIMAKRFCRDHFSSNARWSMGISGGLLGGRPEEDRSPLVDQLGSCSLAR